MPSRFVGDRSGGMREVLVGQPWLVSIRLSIFEPGDAESWPTDGRWDVHIWDTTRPHRYGVAFPSASSAVLPIALFGRSGNGSGPFPRTGRALAVWMGWLAAHSPLVCSASMVDEPVVAPRPWRLGRKMESAPSSYPLSPPQKKCAVKIARS